jgi:hypothetical protein
LFTETDFHVDREDTISTIEWTSPFIIEARYVGFVRSSTTRTGRMLLSLGRTPEEAALLSRNKVSGSGLWRLADQIRING